MLNVFDDKNLQNIPFLLVIEKGNEQMQLLIEKLRNKMNNIEDLVFNLQFVNTSKEIKQINLGIEWLCKVMKPI